MKRGWILFLVLGIILINLNYVLADGGYFPPPGYWIRPGEQKAIIFYEDNTETLILTSGFQGNAKDLVWIIPTPTKPEITKANEEIFTNIAKLAQAKYETKSLSFGKAYMEGAADINRVLILESKKVDYYDVNVIFAVNSEDLVEWFNQNNYSYPEEYSYVLNYYLNKGWFFTAIKISPESQGATEVTQDLEEGHPTPIKMVFLSDKIVFPLKISSVDFKPEDEVKYGAAEDEPIGATRTDANGNVWTKVRITKALYGPAKDEPIGAERTDANGNVWVKIASDDWKIQENVPQGYAGTGWGNILIDQQPGGIDTSNLGGYWTTSAQKYTSVEWADYIIDRQPGGIKYVSNYEYRYGDYIPIDLYVIANEKYEADNFQIKYGNWVEKEQIQDLGDDENGNSFIQPNNEKYYLTHLYADMQKSQMNDDVFLRKADDNKKVNTGPELWQIFIYSLLIGVALIIVWIFTPLGIMFIAGALILFLSSNKIARIFGWIMQCIALVVTSLIGLFFLFLVLLERNLSSYYILSILISGMILIIIMGLLMFKEFRHSKRINIKRRKI